MTALASRAAAPDRIPASSGTVEHPELVSLALEYDLACLEDHTAAAALKAARFRFDAAIGRLSAASGEASRAAGDPAAFGELRIRTGLTEAEAHQLATSGRRRAIARSICAIPTRSLTGLALKARVIVEQFERTPPAETDHADLHVVGLARDLMRYADAAQA